MSRLGPARLDYPPNHIESDNRLTWFLGRLHRKFVKDVFYVHLRRERLAVARSYEQRLQKGMIIPAWMQGIHWRLDASVTPLDAALDYIDTVTANIEHFLRDKPAQMEFSLENARGDFPRFWQRIDAQGDLDAALREWNVAWNATARPEEQRRSRETDQGG